jgi:hypothetical protein
MSHRFNKFFAITVFVGMITISNVTFSPAQASTDARVSGKVIETMDAAGYTYIHVDTGNEKQWVAIPQTELKAGDKVTYLNGMIMSNFQSKSLNRTFPTIIFSPGLEGQKPMNPHGTMPPKEAATPEPKSSNSFAAAVQAEGGSAPDPQPEQLVSGGSAGAVAPFSEITVEKATGDNSVTVAEVFKNKDDLNGKTIRIRGKVIKYNPNIMGKNWIHIQDGTGNPMENNHDLVITTTEEVSTDQIIVVEGKMTANKDFGAGYKYSAIVEEAILIK